MKIFEQDGKKYVGVTANSADAAILISALELSIGLAKSELSDIEKGRLHYASYSDKGEYLTDKHKIQCLRLEINACRQLRDGFIAHNAITEGVDEN